MSPYGIENYGYVPLSGSNAVMLNSLAGAQGNQLVQPVQRSIRQDEIQRAADPFNSNFNQDPAHMAHWGLNESHLGEKDEDGNRIVNKAGLQAMRNAQFGRMLIPENANMIDSGAAGQAAAASLQAQGENQAAGQQARGLFGRIVGAAKGVYARDHGEQPVSNFIQSAFTKQKANTKVTGTDNNDDESATASW